MESGIKMLLKRCNVCHTPLEKDWNYCPNCAYNIPKDEG